MFTTFTVCFHLTAGYRLQWSELFFLAYLHTYLANFSSWTFRNTLCLFLCLVFLPPLWVSRFLLGPLPVAGNNSIPALWTHCMFLCFVCFCCRRKPLWRWHTHQEKCRISPFSIDLSFEFEACLLSPNVQQTLETSSLWLTVMQYWTSFHQTSFFFSPHSFCSSLAFPSCLSQLQLLHSSVRFWEGAPDCCRVRVAQDVTAEPASADRCRSLWQRESGWLLPEPQQQQQRLHQHQERDTVRLAMDANAFTQLTKQLNGVRSRTLYCIERRCIITAFCLSYFFKIVFF